MTAPAEQIVVASSDGVEVVVHHLRPGDPGAPMLVAHATGFHGRAYGPMARSLDDRFDVWSLDFRGHGDTTAPPAWRVDWGGYGDDATAVVEWLAERAGPAGSLVGFGHSMGGAALLMAADRRPELVASLVLFEPIVFPPDPLDGPGPGALAVGARRRRRAFASYREALANYGSKPPMNAFDPAALEAYVRFGLRPVVSTKGTRGDGIDDGTDDEPVELCCAPELEAATFENGATHGTWVRLAGISTPVVVIGGCLGDGPAVIAEPIARQLPNGRYENHPDLDHFGPFTHPTATTTAVSAAIAGPD